MNEDFELLNKLERTGSLCSPNFQTRLVRALESQNFEEFEEALKNGQRTASIDLDYIYEDPRNATLLEIACSSTGNSKFVDVLIRNGASINSVNRIQKKTPLHLAIEHSDLATVKVLVDNKFTNVNIRDSKGNTPLHVAAELNKVSIIDLLLKHPAIKVNETNRKSQTPLHIALRKNHKDSVSALIKNVDIDLDDIKDFSDNTCRQMISDRFPEIELSAMKKTSAVKEGKNLFSLLHNRDINSFKLSIKANKNSLNVDDGRFSLLQYACHHGLLEVVKTLLNNGANPNQVCECNNRPPIMIASFRGHINIVRALIEHGGISFEAGDEGTVLHAILNGIKDYRCGDVLGASAETRDYFECFDYIFKNVASDALDINHQDVNGNTALHLAVEINDPKIVRMLLDEGAYVGFKNNSGDMPISFVSPDVLKSYLDNCVCTNGKQPIDYNYEVIYKYEFLAPPKICLPPEMKNESHFVPETEAADSYVVVSETEPLVAMSRVPELRPFLKHPVLTSFLNLKWYTIRKWFYANVAFYVVFWLSLTLYIMNLYGTTDIDHGFLIPKSQVEGKTGFWILNIIFCSILLIRELFQFGVAPLKYFTSFENWLEVGLIIVTYIILLCGFGAHQLAAVAILLSWTELVLLIGRHPSLSTNIEMFKVVCVNFLQFLAWYSILILAFALSFFLLFNNPSQVGGVEQNQTSNEDAAFFRDPGISIFKSVIMLTGEFDAGSIPFDRYPGISHVLFVLFVFLIAIVLFNLLNGLAVSDTQSIKSDAELVGYVCRAKLISYFENVAIGDPFCCLSFMDKLSCVCCCCVPARRASISKSKHMKFLYSSMNLFPNLFPDSMAHILPSAGNLVIFSSSKPKGKLSKTETSCYERISDWYIDSAIIKVSKEVIAQRESNWMNSDQADILKKYNERIDEFEAKLSAIQEVSKRTERQMTEIMSLLKKRL